MNKELCLKGLAMLTTSFPEKEIISEVVYPCLKDLSEEEYMKAIIVILKTEKQITKATNIIALIREKALKKDSMLAGEAWLTVQNAIMSIGSYGKPKFANPLIQNSVNILGWRNLCLSENQIADRAHFFKIYDTLVSREENRVLIGKDTGRLLK